MKDIVLLNVRILAEA